MRRPHFRDMAATAPQFVTSDAVKAWLFDQGVAAGVGEIMQVAPLTREEWIEQFDIPAHVAVALTGLAEREGDEALQPAALDSIPFVSLCRGVLLPLSAIARERARALFGLAPAEPLDSAARMKLVEDFFQREIGLTTEEKVAVLLGEPYGGRKGGFRRDSLFNAVASLALTSRGKLAERLARIGDPAAVVAELRPVNPPEAPLSAREVMLTLRALPGRGRIERTLALRSLLSRTGRIEAYFLSRLLMRHGVPGFEFQTDLMARLVAERFGVDAEAVATAAALLNLPEVAGILEREGEPGLRRIRLQPLLAFRPALAGPAVDESARYPLWVERKYDGIRLLLHKETDLQGNVLVAAYTRQRNDWTELVPGIEAVARSIPARRVILDGELYALRYQQSQGQGQMRPAAVYELHSWLTGDRSQPLNLRYVVFDLIYLDGHDLTERPLTERRQMLDVLMRPLASWPLPLPVSVSEGQLAPTRADVNRLFQFFRKQGYEGVVAKDPASAYHLGRRERSWMKMKPELTLDLVLIGGFYTMGSGGARGFGSYLLGARGEGQQVVEVGDVAGVDQQRTQSIVSTLFAQGLLTGQPIERVGPTGLKQGQAFQPGIVVTVRFEGIVRAPDGRLSLRDPKIITLRPDKSAAECDLVSAIEAIHLSERLG
jgi:DNA ligase-1